MRADPAEFRRLDLRCHSLLSNVPLHDVWAIPLVGGGPHRTMRDVYAISPFARLSSRRLAVRGLFALRRGLGRLFRLDKQTPGTAADSYLHRLTDADRAASLVVPGTREGPFRTLYVFADEAVAEARNATVHAFLVTALRAERSGYTLYLAVYVKPVGLLTAPYMALIDPFRHYIVYPALIRETQAAWARAYG